MALEFRSHSSIVLMSKCKDFAWTAAEITAIKKRDKT